MRHSIENLLHGVDAFGGNEIFGGSWTAFAKAATGRQADGAAEGRRPDAVGILVKWVADSPGTLDWSLIIVGPLGGMLV
jgi:hypothetical protein